MSTQLSHVRTFIHEDYDTNIVRQHLAAAVVLGKIYVEYSIALKSQNVDGYNVTPVTRDRFLSTEIACNSGSGMYMVGTTHPAVAETFLFGGTAANQITSTIAGDDYFVRTIGSQWIAKQDLELLVSVKLASAGNITALRYDFVRNGAASSDNNVVTATADQTAAVIGLRFIGFSPLTNLEVAVIFAVKLDKGDSWAVHSTGPAGGLTASRVVMTPFVFRLNV